MILSLFGAVVSKSEFVNRKPNLGNFVLRWHYLTVSSGCIVGLSKCGCWLVEICNNLILQKFNFNIYIIKTIRRV